MFRMITLGCAAAIAALAPIVPASAETSVVQLAATSTVPAGTPAPSSAPSAAAGQAPATGAPALSTSTSAHKPLTKQQQRMKDCSQDAKTKQLKGDARKQFMKTCLSQK